jgi:elongator complex protein 3
MMPGLPGSTPEKDLNSFKKIFTDQKFMPDMIKIYPTLVMSGTELYEDWKAGRFKPLTTTKATQLVSKINKIVPEWVRVMRVQRDIPTNLISAGVTKSNLRQLAKGKCNCIRCREIGHKLRQGKTPKNIQIRTQKYNASGGTEYFISAEDFKEKILIGYLRLRKTPTKWIVRELHVYGTEVAIGKTAQKTAMQHRGWGRKLLKKAEEIANGKLFVLSGIGAREYYRKFEYEYTPPYMIKKF